MIISLQVCLVLVVQELQSYEYFGGTYEKTNIDFDRFAACGHFYVCFPTGGVRHAQPY
jgi:hypothetical protein